MELKTTLLPVAGPGARLAAHAFDTRIRGGKNLLVLHALGLCSKAYRPFVESFLEASNSSNVGVDADLEHDDETRYSRVVFLDLRHHGDSEADNASLAWARHALWETLARDVTSAVRALRFSSPPDILAHSLGAGVVAVAAAAAAPATPLFGSLFLFEPPFYPLVAADVVGKGGRQRDLAKDNASFAASAAAASALSFENVEEAAQLLEVAPPFKWWHESCQSAFVESGLREKEEEDEEGGEGRNRQQQQCRRLVLKCGGAALSALASGLMTSPGGPTVETYRRVAAGCADEAGAAGERGRGGGGREAVSSRQQQRRRRRLVIAYSRDDRSDVTAFLRAGAVAAGAAAAAAASSASSASSSAVVVLPVRLPQKKDGRSSSSSSSSAAAAAAAAENAASGHYLPLVAPRELGEVAAAALMASASRMKTMERSRAKF